MKYDPAEFFRKNFILLQRISINNFSDPQISTYTTINTNFKSIQKGLDERTKNSDDEFLYCPDILCIKIERITPKGLDNTEIDINETLTFSIENENGSKCDGTYSLNSVICHRNIIPKFDHFISIVDKENKRYYCDN